MKAITANYSTYTDHNTGARFMPVLHRAEGVYIGVADVTEEQGIDLRNRGFIVLTDADYADGMQREADEARAKQEAEAESHNESGDPLQAAIGTTVKSPKENATVVDLGAGPPPPPGG